MPLIKPSPTGPSHLQAVQVVTTTIFSPSPTADSGKHSSSVPVPAIVGGVIGGVVLAIVVTLIWLFWGREIKKTKRKQEEEKEKHYRTKYNTIRNAQISGPKSHSYRPQLKRQLNDKHIKFANDTKATTMLPPAEKVDPERAKHMLFDNPHSPPRPAWTIEQRLRRAGSVVWPMPRIQSPLKKLSQNSIQQNNGESHTRDGTQRHDTVSHKRSDVSENSNMSTESRQSRTPANLILAALGSRGNSGSFHSADRQSSSSLWSNLFRMVPGARSSQHSAANSYQQPAGEQNYPVGTAL